MKTYKTIKKSNQVNTGDVLVEFYTNSTDIWNTFNVYNIDSKGITLECKSGALLFVSNDRLETKKEFFKRVY